MENFISTPSSVTAFASIAAGLAAFIWWLIRIRLNRIWLPTVRILRLESPELPKLRVVLPPIFPFICFLAAAGTLVFFSLRPQEQLYAPFEPEQTRIHLFLDLSPSVARLVTLPQFSKTAVDLWASLQKSGRVTVSTSHSPDFQEFQSEDELEKKILQIGFHRPGLRLGSALTKQLERLGPIDQLFVLSDQDQHSWNDFNWRYLLDDMAVSWIPIRDRRNSTQSNFFINKARFVSLPSAMTMDWEVEIERAGTSTEAKGVLKANHRDLTLATVPWAMPAGVHRVAVSVAWPTQKIPAAGGGTDDQDPLVWTIDGVDEDGLGLDNEFRTAFRGGGQEVLLVSESGGERMLEDASHQIEVSLDVLGFRVRKFDRIEQPGPNPTDFPLWVILGGHASNIDEFCPQSIASDRRARAAGNTQSKGSLPRVWLVPRDLGTSYSGLCWCFHRLVKSDSTSSPMPDFCKDAPDRDSYIRVLSSLGAKQVGGELGQDEGAIAWNGEDEFHQLQVLAFTIPLRPSRQTGIDHGRLPILIKNLLGWQKLLSLPEAAGSWPRITDISETAWEKDDESQNLKFQLTNIPYGESALEAVADDLMPPIWTAQLHSQDKKLPLRKDREDPTVWLYRCGLIVVGAMAAEILWFAGSWLLRTLSRRRRAAALIVLGFVGFPLDSNAQISLPLLGFPAKLTFNTAANEVAQRTSLALDNQGESWRVIAEDLLEQPLIWAASLNDVVDPSGVLKPEVAIWVRRGGLLIIERGASAAAMAKLTSIGFDSIGAGGGWMAIPPDHVLMRSFYLLDSLPSCGGDVWSGFHFDDRMAIVVAPLPFVTMVSDDGIGSDCNAQISREMVTRTFVNLLMVALATDYKKDQIHLPEILKRLR